MGERAIIFDLDGTLVDSAPSIHAATAAMMTELGHPVPTLSDVKGFIGNGVPMLVERCLRWAGAVADPTAVTVLRRIYDADPVSGTRVFEGVPEMLADLSARGWRLGLCTNKPETPTHTLLSALDLGPFDAVVGGDTLATRKPDAAPLLQVVQTLGATQDATLYVGDSLIDWQTAQNAGVPYVHLTGGYENDPHRQISTAHCFDDIPALHAWLTTL